MNNRPRAKHAHTNTRNQNPTKNPLMGAFQLLNDDLQAGVRSQGYNQPTPIQEQAIPYLLQGRDLIGTAQTGTGKTAAFVLPLIQLLQKENKRPVGKKPSALILAPTRELAAQIGDSIRNYGKFTRINQTTIFGGVNQNPQVKALQRGVDIVVATPGRLLDLMQQGHLDLTAVKYFILDEVDRMLDMGFLPDMRRVLKVVPKKRQTLFFSATMAKKMQELANTMVQDPAYVSIEPEQPAVERIAQKVLFVGKKNKDALLLSLMNRGDIEKAIVFTQMKHVANKVAKKLQSAGFSGEAIHGNKSQSARTKALNGFKQDRLQVLVATDVAARGIDVDDITHVINYDLPVEADTYVHRIGRTARAGAEGDAISFCSPDERPYLNDIELLLGNQVNADLDHEFHSHEAYQAPVSAKQKKPNSRNRSYSKRPRRQRR